MKIPFSASPEYTIGIEWELGLVDRRNGDLTSAAEDVFAILDDHAPEHRVYRELLRNTVELVTGICHDVPEGIGDLAESMGHVMRAADRLGLDLFSAGMHPFATWETQKITAAARYHTLIDRTQYWGRQMLIFGIHVHVGLPQRDRVLPVLNSLLRFYPHLQSLSASSPYYLGTGTGYASNRAMLFQQLPTAGLPFQFDHWRAYEAYVDDMMVTGVIDKLNEIRWDIRPSPTLGTIEVRVCDAMATFEEVAAIAALIHCLVVDLDQRLARGEPLPTLPPWHVQENKWRAARYGMDAIIILDDGNHEALVTEDLERLLEELGPLSRDLNCGAELQLVRRMLDAGAGYERQRDVARANRGDLRSVVDSVVGELKASFQRVPKHA